MWLLKSDFCVQVQQMVQQSDMKKKNKSIRMRKQMNLSLNPTVLIGCEEHIQLQQQWPQEMISVKTAPTTIKMC